MGKIFGTKTPNFYKHIFPHMKDKKMAISIASTIEFYGISQHQIDKEFGIDKELKESIYKNIDKSLKSADDSVSFFDTALDIYTKRLKEKITKEGFNEFLSKRIKSKKQNINKTVAYKNLYTLLEPEYKHTLNSNSVLDILMINRFLCYDFTRFGCFGEKSDSFKKDLSESIDRNMCGMVNTYQFVPPFFQIWSNSWKIRKAMSSMKSDRRTDIVNGILNSGNARMKLQADRMDSEMIFLSLFGSAFRGGGPVQCFTMDSYEVTLDRFKISYYLWDLSIKKYSKIAKSRIKLNFDNIGRISFFTSDYCLKKENIDFHDQKTKKDIQLFLDEISSI